MWIKYKWKKGDTFDKLAKTSKVKNADIILNFPGNKEVLKKHKAGEVPAIGTEVYILDPKAKIYKTKVNGKEIYFGEPELNKANADQKKLMKDFVTGAKARQTWLEGWHQKTCDARDEYVFFQWLLDEAHIVEPKAQRSKSQKAIAKLEAISKTDKAHDFYKELPNAEKAFKAYHEATKAWIKALQQDLANDMWWIGVAGDFAKGAATVAIVTVAAPASIPAAILYGALAGGGVSLLSDTSRAGTAVAIGAKPPSMSEVVANCLSSAAVGGVSGGLVASFMRFVAPSIITAMSSSSVVSAQATRLALSSGHSAKIYAAIAKGAGEGIELSSKEIGAIAISAMAPLFSRISATALNKYIGSSAKVKEAVFGQVKKNHASLKGKNATQAGQSVADAILSGKLMDQLYDGLIGNFWKEYEKLLIAHAQVHAKNR